MEEKKNPAVGGGWVLGWEERVSQSPGVSSLRPLSSLSGAKGGKTEAVELNSLPCTNLGHGWCWN